MSLLTRLVAPSETEERIAVHTFVAAMAELKRGHVTVNQVFVEFDLSVAEQSQLTTWYVAEIVSGNITIDELHEVLLLGEAELYSANAVKDRLNL